MVQSKIDIWNLALGRVGINKQVSSETERTAEANACKLLYDFCLKELYERHDWAFAMTEVEALTKVDTQTDTYTGDGSTTRFDVLKRFRTTDQVTVTVAGESQTLGTDYTFTQDESATGDNYITFTSAPANSAAIVITTDWRRPGWDHVFSLPSNFVRAVGFVYDDVRFELYPDASKVPFDVQLSDGDDALLLFTDFNSGDYDAFKYVALVTHVPAMTSHFVSALADRMAMELAQSLRKDGALARQKGQDFLQSMDEAICMSENMHHHRPEVKTPSLVARSQSSWRTVR